MAAPTTKNLACWRRPTARARARSRARACDRGGTPRADGRAMRLHTHRCCHPRRVSDRARDARPVTSFGSNPGALADVRVRAGELAERATARRRAARLHADRVGDGERGLERARRSVPLRGRCIRSSRARTTRSSASTGPASTATPRTSRAGRARTSRSCQMVDYEIATHGVDTTRVYVAGLLGGRGVHRGDARDLARSVRGRRDHVGHRVPLRDAVSGAYSCQSPGVTKTAAAVGRPRARGVAVHRAVAAHADLAGHVRHDRRADERRPSSSSSGPNVLGHRSDRRRDRDDRARATRTAYKVGNRRSWSRPTRSAG